MIICKNCGTRNLNKTRLCKNCNAPIVAKRKIPSTLITKSEKKPIPDTIVALPVNNKENLDLGKKKAIPNTVITVKNQKDVPPTLSFSKKTHENIEKEYPLPDIEKEDIFVKYNDMVSPIFQDGKNDSSPSQDIVICTYCRAENVSFYEQCQVCGNKLNTTSAKKNDTAKIWQQNSGEKQCYPLGDKENIIGRDEGTILFPESQYISKRHCKIYHHQQKIVVDDLGSMNGTYLKLRKPYLLKDGDIFSVGKQIFQFRLVKKAEKSIVPKRITGAFLPSEFVPKAKLVYFIEQGGYDITLLQNKVILGRESGSIVFSDDATLSPQHASIYTHKSGYILQDLDSEFGTWIRITRPSILKNNDMFRVGEHIFCLDFPVE